MKIKQLVQKIFPFPIPGLGSPRSGTLPSAWSARQWSTVLRGGVLGDVSLDMFMRASATIACCNLIADTLASAPIGVQQQDPDTGTAEVNESEASDALLNFAYDDRSAMIFGAALMGNGFAYYDGTNLRALDSFRTMVYIGPDGTIWVKEAVGPYMPYTSMAHVKFRHQPGFVLGYNPALLAQDSLKTALGLIGMSGAMATNSSTPGNVLEAPNALSDKAIKQIKDSYHEVPAGGVAVLEEGLKLHQLDPPSATDAQMIEGLEWSSSDICRLYGVPPTLVGLTKDSNKSSSGEESIGFYQRCIRHWAARVTDALGRQLLTPAERKQGLVIAFDLSSLQIGYGKPAPEYWAQLTNSGIAATNDSRDALGLPDVPQGDRVRVPANMVFLDKLDQMPIGAANGQPAQGTP